MRSSISQHDVHEVQGQCDKGGNQHQKLGRQPLLLHVHEAHHKDADTANSDTLLFACCERSSSMTD